MQQAASPLYTSYHHALHGGCFGVDIIFATYLNIWNIWMWFCDLLHNFANVNIGFILLLSVIYIVNTDYWNWIVIIYLFVNNKFNIQ
jgi:hypothetical protein